MSTVAGDPASCSHLGGCLRRLAARLRTAGRANHDARDASAIPDASAIEARGGAEALDAATAAAAHELDMVGAALHARAGDLAEAIAGARRAIERATSTAPPFQSPTDLQQELDHVTSLLDSRRRRLRALLHTSTQVLQRHASTLRAVS
ncbi:hypothetical protein [Pedococcus sp. 5OH_020]|uniref:hypothetical protein n=1 Tax=Pedococcus sp. 5OH_020 TaxID=2989814 RepID=UPI0022E99910|nr:hypothetical protein [Pedococcus sp. 5OH_020]